MRNPDPRRGDRPFAPVADLYIAKYPEVICPTRPISTRRGEEAGAEGAVRFQLGIDGRQTAPSRSIVGLVTGFDEAASKAMRQCKSRRPSATMVAPSLDRNSLGISGRTGLVAFHFVDRRMDQDTLMHLFAQFTLRGPPSMTSTTWSPLGVVLTLSPLVSPRRRVHVGVRRTRADPRRSTRPSTRSYFSRRSGRELPHRRQPVGAGAQQPPWLRAERQLPAQPVPGPHAGRDARHVDCHYQLVERAGGRRWACSETRRASPFRSRSIWRATRSTPWGCRATPPHGERHRRRARRRQGAARDAGRGRGYTVGPLAGLSLPTGKSDSGRTWATRTSPAGSRASSRRSSARWRRPPTLASCSAARPRASRPRSGTSFCTGSAPSIPSTSASTSSSRCSGERVG